MNNEKTLAALEAEIEKQVAEIEVELKKGREGASDETDQVVEIDLEKFKVARAVAPGASPDYEKYPFPKNVSLFQRVSVQERSNAQFSNQLEAARTSEDPNEALQALNFLLHAIDSDLIRRVPADFTPKPVAIQTPSLDRVLSPIAQALSRIVINKTIHEVHVGDDLQTTLCAYASKVVPLGTIGQIDDVYIKRWSNFLNDLAAKGIWQYGSMVPFGIIELGGFRNTPPRAAIFSFIFTRLTTTSEGKVRNETHEELNELLGTDAFRLEGDIGSNDWSESKFPW